MPPLLSDLLDAAAAVCLVVGFLAGGRTDLLPRTSGADESSSAMLLTAGAVMKGAGGGSTDGDDFEVPLYNRSDEKFDVTVVDPRGAWATTQRFPGVKVIQDWADEAFQAIHLVWGW